MLCSGDGGLLARTQAGSTSTALDRYRPHSYTSSHSHHTSGQSATALCATYQSVSRGQIDNATSQRYQECNSNSTQEVALFGCNSPMTQQEDRHASTLLGFSSRIRAFPDSFWPVQIGTSKSAWWLQRRGLACFAFLAVVRIGCGGFRTQYD
jgi:hypothetical protein